jgi:hypothetical protein
MRNPVKTGPLLAVTAILLLAVGGRALGAVDKELLPPQLTKEQRENLLRFLQKHEKPDRFIPPDAKLDASASDVKKDQAADKPIKQYLVQMILHRPVQGQEKVKRVDLYYYRPNPDKGKPGITVVHTVDFSTGEQVGPTRVLLKRHTPLSREELAEAVALALEKSAAVQDLYKGRAKNAVHWEFLQLVIQRPHEPHEPGDRVVRFVFTAPAAKNQPAPTPVRVVVNLTKGVVGGDVR